MELRTRKLTPTSTTPSKKVRTKISRPGMQTRTKARARASVKSKPKMKAKTVRGHEMITTEKLDVTPTHVNDVQVSNETSKISEPEEKGPEDMGLAMWSAQLTRELHDAAPTAVAAQPPALELEHQIEESATPKRQRSAENESGMKDESGAKGENQPRKKRVRFEEGEFAECVICAERKHRYASPFPFLSFPFLSPPLHSSYPHTQSQLHICLLSTSKTRWEDD